MYIAPCVRNQRIPEGRKFLKNFAVSIWATRAVRNSLFSREVWIRYERTRTRTRASTVARDFARGISAMVYGTKGNAVCQNLLIALRDARGKDGNVITTFFPGGWIKLVLFEKVYQFITNIFIKLFLKEWMWKICFLKQSFCIGALKKKLNIS